MGFWNWKPPAKRLGLRGPDRLAPQKRGARDWDIDLLGLNSPVGTGVSSLEPLSIVLNQGSTSSCVSQAWEGALLIEAKKLGLGGRNLELGSRLYGYFNSRSLHGAQFADAGTYLRSYAAGLKLMGRCPERYWKFLRSRINRRPSVRAYQQAHAMRGLRGYYRIYDRGERRLDAVCSALEAGHPVVFGMRVDRAFTENIGNSVITIPKGRFIGGHAMTVIGYRLVGGTRRFRVLNSWGTGWRNEGKCWFTEELMAWPLLEDVWCASLR